MEFRLRETAYNIALLRALVGTEAKESNKTPKSKATIYSAIPKENDAKVIENIVSKSQISTKTRLIWIKNTTSRLKGKSKK